MKVKTIEAFKIQDEMRRLKISQKVLPVKVAYFLKKNERIIQEETKEYLEQEKEILNRLCEKTRIIPEQLIEKVEEEIKKQKIKGKEKQEAFREKFKVDKFTAKKEKEKELQKELQKLQSIENDINFHKIKLDDFDDMKINPDSIDSLIEFGLIEE